MKLFPHSKSVVFFLMSLILSAFLTQTAGAETKEGDLELNIQGAYQNVKIDEADNSTDNLILKIRLGYFFNPEINLEVALDDTRTNTDDFDTHSFALELRTNYHFLTSGTVIPYLGPSLGMFYNSFDFGGNSDNKASGIFGGQFGLKSFLTETVAVTTEYSIRRTFGSGSDIEERTINQVLVGISYFWR